MNQPFRTMNQPFHTIMIPSNITRESVCQLVQNFLQYDCSWFLKIGNYIIPDDIDQSEFINNESIFPFGKFFVVLTHPNCKIEFIVEEPENPDTNSRTVLVGPEELRKGLDLMANDPKYNHHFENFMNHDDDCITADIFMQFVIYGEIIY